MTPQPETSDIPQPLSFSTRSAAALDRVRAAIATRKEKVVVVDDDPTGTQTVRDVPVYFSWDTDTMAEALVADGPGFFITTNSRSMTAAEAAAVNREVGLNLRKASHATGVAVRPFSRSDSTLRGHFPVETDALEEGLGQTYHGVLLAPFFAEGGRVTIGGTHYLIKGGSLLAVGDTEFSRDPVFGYQASWLPEWVEEKYEGRIRAFDVCEITLSMIRRGGVEVVANALCSLDRGRVCVIDSTEVGDMQVVAAAVVLAEDRGRRFMWRCAASAVQARLGQASSHQVSPEDLRRSATGGGLVVVGSWVDLSTRQLEQLLKGHTNAEAIEANVDELLDPQKSATAVSRLAARVDAAMAAGRLAVLYSSRARAKASGGAEFLSTSARIGDCLVQVVEALQVRPAYFIAKGGITSHRMAQEALRLKRAHVLGALLPGVPLWETGNDCTWPGIHYVVFPGNVGTDDSLLAAVNLFDNAPQTPDR